MPTLRPESAVTLFGLPARAFAVFSNDSGIILNQTISTSREFLVGDRPHKLTVRLRFDDECRNGHETFSITADLYERDGKRWREVAGGCLHDEISKHFPELRHLIRWHLVSTDGPMHYISNTVFLAGDRDCWGYRADEQKRDKKSGLPLWQRHPDDLTPPHIIDSEASPTVTLRYVPLCGEGKVRELDAARHAAVWPEATDDDLTAPGLSDRLAARLPALLAAFRADMEAAGFLWPEPKKED